MIMKSSSCIYTACLALSGMSQPKITDNMLVWNKYRHKTLQSYIAFLIYLWKKEKEFH